jgi:hypothetical protein
MSKNYITKLVITILRKNEEARDEMLLVVKNIHDFEMSILNIDKSNYYDVFFSHKLSSVKTIDRIWRKVQEDCPDLRGKLWQLRQVQSGQVSLEFVSDKFQLKLFDENQLNNMDISKLNYEDDEEDAI